MSRRRRSRGSRVADMLPPLAEPGRAVPRRLRVERDLHEKLTQALRGQRDERLQAASITRVEVTGDLSFARIFVRVDVASDIDKDALMQALEGATGRLRTAVTQSASWRRAPELRFLYDAGVEAAERVDELLAEIESEREEAEES